LKSVVVGKPAQTDQKKPTAPKPKTEVLEEIEETKEAAPKIHTPKEKVASDNGDDDEVDWIQEMSPRFLN
jgi:hypothetical protein